LGERPHQRAQPGARIGRVGVRRVVDEWNAAAPAESDEIGFRHAKQRPQERDAAARSRRRHAGEARYARAAQKPEEHRLCLIVGVVSCRDRIGADREGVSGEQPVARLPRPLLETGRRLRAGPGERLMRNAEALAQSRDRRGLVRAFGSETVVDGRGEHLSAAPCRPSSAHQKERGRVGSAGNGDQGRLRRRERRQERVDPRVGKGLGARGAQQWFFAISRSAKRFTEGVAVG
jgi:hypothetical protein